MKTINLQIKSSQARRLYQTADECLKTILEASAPCGFFSNKITDRIQSYEDACDELGEQPMDEKEMSKIGFRADEIARRKIETITRALNEGVVMDWENDSQRKYYPWFDASSGFDCDGTDCDYSIASAGLASRLCFKSDELARYAGRQFNQLYKEFMV